MWSGMRQEAPGPHDEQTRTAMEPSAALTWSNRNELITNIIVVELIVSRERCGQDIDLHLMMSCFEQGQE
jgi:hypothetical protein